MSAEAGFSDRLRWPGRFMRLQTFGEGILETILRGVHGAPAHAMLRFARSIGADLARIVNEGGQS